jgi:hypothetical protein
MGGGLFSESIPDKTQCYYISYAAMLLGSTINLTTDFVEDPLPPDPFSRLKYIVL